MAVWSGGDSAYRPHRLARIDACAAGAQSSARISGKRPWFHGNLVVAGSPALRFRYTEERIYPGDAIYALGWLSSEPPMDSAVSEDFSADREADETPVEVEAAEGDEESEANVPGNEEAEWDKGKARRLARAHFLKPAQGHYLISTLPRAEVLKTHRLGGVGALGIGFIGALLLAGVLAMRFG
ncbi:MAG: hypothetical protein WCE49_01935 [Terrimicrobiaceae bacterium]